jgi:hypothetical protein
MRHNAATFSSANLRARRLRKQPKSRNPGTENRDVARVQTVELQGAEARIIRLLPTRRPAGADASDRDFTVAQRVPLCHRLFSARPATL